MKKFFRSVFVGTCVEIKFYGAFFASTSTPSTRRLLDGVAMPHPTHWLISTQVGTGRSE